MAQPQAPEVSFQRSGAVAPANTATADLISNLGKVAGEAVKGFQEGRLEKGFSNIADASSTVSEVTDYLTQQGKTPEEISSALNQVASFDPSKQTVIPGLDLPPDLQKRLSAVKMKAQKEFDAIAQGVSQGATSADAAALALEAKTRQLVNETPGFGPEIKQMAREIAGFDPSGYALRQILDVTKPKGPRAPLTAWEKMQERADAIHQGLGKIGINVDTNTIIGNLALSDQNAVELSNADARLKLNNIDAQEWINQRISSRSPDLGKVLLQVAGVGKVGGITQPQEYINVIEQQKAQDKSDILATLSQVKGGVGQDVISQAYAAIDGQYKPLEDGIKNNSLGELLKTKLDNVAKLNQVWGNQTLPMLTTLAQAFKDNPQIASQLVDMMANTADPSQFKLLASFDPGISALLASGGADRTTITKGIGNTIQKVLKGEQLTPEDLQFQRAAEHVVMSDPNAKDVRENFILKMGDTAPIRATSLLATMPRMQASKAEVKFMSDQYKLYVARADDVNNPTLPQQVANDIPKDKIGTLQVDPKTGLLTVDTRIGYVRQGEQTFTTGPIPDSLKKLNVFVKAANKGYDKDFGVSRQTFAQDLVRRVQAAAGFGTVTRKTDQNNGPNADQQFMTDFQKQNINPKNLADDGQ